LSTWNMWETKQPVLIGPSSSWAVDGRNFFFGPAPYYLALPALVLFGWEQLSVSIVLTSFQLIAGLFVFWVLVRKKQPWLAWLFLIMYGFSAWGIHTSRYFWNPNFTYPIGGFSLGLTLLINS